MRIFRKYIKSITENPIFYASLQNFQIKKGKLSFFSYV